jgi:hypothetical protein
MYVLLSDSLPKYRDLLRLFGFLHLRAFSYKPYRPIHDPKSKTPPPTPTPRLRSLGHVLDFRETFREIRIGWIYIWDKMCGREPTPDKGARRIAQYESAFGRPRPSDLPKILTDTGRSEANAAEKGLLSPSKPKERWLGHDRREKSESLEVQIARELQRRGYDSRTFVAYVLPNSDAVILQTFQVVVTLVLPMMLTALPTTSLNARGGEACTPVFPSRVPNRKRNSISLPSLQDRRSRNRSPVHEALELSRLVGACSLNMITTLRIPLHSLYRTEIVRKIGASDPLLLKKSI